MVEPLSYFSFQPVLHNWCNKGCGMYHPVRINIFSEIVVHEAVASFLSHYEWSFTICPTPNNSK